jgi:hypothetical protein
MICDRFFMGAIAFFMICDRFEFMLMNVIYEHPSIYCGAEGDRFLLWAIALYYLRSLVIMGDRFFYSKNDQ